MLNKAILGSRPTFRITVSAGSGGTASVNKQYASAGETVTISISAYSNYRIDSVTVTGTTVSGSGSTRTFVMPSQNVTVSVSFYYVAPSYSISLSTGSGGTARLSTTSATAGTRVYIYITPSTGYEISSVSASGASVSGSGTTYYFTMPSRSVTVSVSFKVYATHTLTVRADSYGEDYGYYAGKFGNLTPNTIDGRTINAFYFAYSGLATKIYISPRTNIKQIQVTRLDTQETYTARQYNDYFYFYETFLKSSDKDKTIRLNIKLISS